MTSRQAYFVWMLLDILCRIMISILTNNIALTFYMSPMRRDIFRWGRIFNFTFPQFILLNTRPVGFQQITIWPNMTKLEFELNYDTCLMDKRVRMGINVVQTVAAIFPYLCLERNPEAWSNTEGRLEGLLDRPDVCKLEQFEASRHRGRSGRESTSFEWLAGNRIFWLVNCAESSE
jgi:hypothetical protein